MASAPAELLQVRGGLAVAGLEPEGLLEVATRVGELAELPSRDPAIDVGVGVYPAATHGTGQLPIAFAVPLVLDQKGPEVVTQTRYPRRDTRRLTEQAFSSRSVSGIGEPRGEVVEVIRQEVGARHMDEPARGHRPVAVQLRESHRPPLIQHLVRESRVRCGAQEHVLTQDDGLEPHALALADREQHRNDRSAGSSTFDERVRDRVLGRRRSDLKTGDAAFTEHRGENAGLAILSRVWASAGSLDEPRGGAEGHVGRAAHDRSVDSEIPIEQRQQATIPSGGLRRVNREE